MDRILERLSRLPVIDVHTHFEGLMDTFGYTKRYLDFALDAFPLERTCYFGSDRHCAGFPVAAALEQADQLLAAFFAPRIQRGC